ncbi:hypothetical protein BOX15_Mlig025057g1 [Macrostomum lignano]|uniref:Innexin n=1 Tax=Macrostomum lignano TaxID=282301 RepID=A0A267G8D1_9PLAT|nr:hypothetical protein BOX15_Mlig025057g1 [Macrostomum lignano]
MDSHFLHEFTHAAESHGVYAEDFADRLCSKYTCIGLLFLASVGVMRQYVFKPIQCWVPAEWPRPWEEFAENYCWVQNTYRVALREPSYPEARERGGLEIGYYQWVPIVLLAQALLSMAPHQLWLLASRRLAGFDPHSVLRFAREVEHAGNKDTSKRLLTYAAWHLAWGARLSGRTYDPDGALLTDDKPNKLQAERQQQQKPQGRRSCSEAVRQSGCLLFILYLLNKLLCAGTAAGQVFLLQSYLGFASPLFGWQCASNLLRGGTWELTGVFPRLTFCDLPLRHVGQFNLRSVQCVLASNMMNEKIFVFLWFWFAVCCLTSLMYTISWMAQLLPPTERTRLVRRYLSLQARRGHGQQRPAANGREDVYKASRQLTDLLRLDGVLLLQMVADNVDCLCAAQLAGRLRDQRDRTFDTNDYCSEDDDLQLRPLINDGISSEGSSGDGLRQKVLTTELKISSV